MSRRGIKAGHSPALTVHPVPASATPPQHWILRMKGNSLAFGPKWRVKKFLCLWTCDLNFRKCVLSPRSCGGPGRAWWGAVGCHPGALSVAV